MKTYQEMTSFSLKLLKIFFILCFCKFCVFGKTERPNVIVILSDDMGYTDIGCYGGEINTPVLDGLAKNGLRFTQFYNTGRCCPTRASLLTGLYPHQAGLGGMTRDSGVAGYRGDLNKSSVTIAEVMKAGGYQTFISGKWHVTTHVRPQSESQKFNWPLQRGFDRFYGTIDGAGSFWDPSSLTRGNQFITPVNDKDYQPEIYYYTDAISDNAVSFIEERDKEKPFFMYVPYTAAHWPMHAYPEDIAKYKGAYDEGYEPIRKERLKRAIELGVVPEGTKMSPMFGDWETVKNKKWEVSCMEVYAAMVDRMDQGIGKIVQQLKRESIFDNTLILFFQDNGGCQEPFGRKKKKLKKDREPYGADEFQQKVFPTHTRSGKAVRNGPGVIPGPDDTYIAYGEGWANVSNTPFRMYKHYVHEGGIATPLIAHWPKGISAKNELRHTPSHLIDIMATCVELGNADYPKEYKGHAITPMEGKSLISVFQDDRLDRDYLFWEHEGNRAVRVGDWKLVANSSRRSENVKWELYDLAKDRSELNDLKQTYPEKFQELKALWNKQAKHTKVIPWPIHKKKKK